MVQKALITARFQPMIVTEVDPSIDVDMIPEEEDPREEEREEEKSLSLSLSISLRISLCLFLLNDTHQLK